MILNVSETQTSKIITGSNVIALTLSSTPDEIKDTINDDIITLKDLELWDKFEKLNPNSFREMYQFWVRKSIK